jgi:hypothetical protein
MDASPSFDALLRNCQDFVKANRRVFDELADAIRTYLQESLADHAPASSAKWRSALEKRPEASARSRSPGAEKARQALSFYFDNYEPYDMLVLPIVYGTDAGESAIVDIFRVSPVNASFPHGSDLAAKSHVYGNRYSHFGAFLEQVWRENDVMWGRMDAASCIIEALLPDFGDAKKRAVVQEALVKEAHQRIVHEELGERGRQALTTTLLDELSKHPPASGGAATPSEYKKSMDDAVAALVGKLGNAQSGSKLQQLLVASLGEAQLLEYVTRLQTDWKLPPEAEVNIMTNGTHVLGEVLKGVAGGKGAMAKPGAWISLIGRLGASVAEVAVPKSFMHLLRWHWFALIVTFEAFALAGGILTSTQPVTQFGLIALMLTLLGAGAVWSMGRFYEGKKVLPIAITVIAIVVGGLMALGVVELAHLGKQHSWIPVFGQATPTRSPSPSSTSSTPSP